jgi:hypothetical protein
VAHRESEGRRVRIPIVPAAIRFAATLKSPRPSGESSARPGAAGKAGKAGGSGRGPSWTFVVLTAGASAGLPSRGLVSVRGTMEGVPFRAALSPDGRGGHWLRVDRRLRERAGVRAGDAVTIEITPMSEEPEPRVPTDLRRALAASPKKAREAWADITPAARRDFIHWVVSPKQAQTRARRIASACDMLAKGKRRPCCFDRSGMFDKSLACPVADDEPGGSGR